MAARKLDFDEVDLDDADISDTGAWLLIDVEPAPKRRCQEAPARAGGACKGGGADVALATSSAAVSTR